MRKPGSAFIFVPFGVALLLAGCGDFWKNPYETGTGTTASTTTLTASTATPTTGTSVTLTATVTPAAATGTVTFYSNTTSIGTGALSSGTATLSTTFTSVGTASLTATYGGSSTYASSTSGAVSVTVTASAASVGVKTGGIYTTGVFASNGGSFIATNAEAAVAEAGASINLTNATLSGTAGNGRGVLLGSATAQPGSTSTTSFIMTGGSLTYSCDATSTPSCAEGSVSSGRNNPATLFSVANTTAAISLTEVKVTNHTPSPDNSYGTLLTVETPAAGTDGSNAGSATLKANGTALDGDVIVDDLSTAALAILEDDSGTGSSLTGAIDTASRGKTINVTLDKASVWTVTATSYLATLNGLDLDGATVNNIDGGGHCVYYSGSVNGSSGKTIYALSGGGFLAPAGTTGLDCE